jgi:hypothetical protein
MAKGLTDILIDKAHELEEQYREILEKRAANRRSLRDLDAQELLTAEQSALVEELYPQRQRAEDAGE